MNCVDKADAAMNLYRYSHKHSKWTLVSETASCNKTGCIPSLVEDVIGKLLESMDIAQCSQFTTKSPNSGTDSTQSN